MHYFLRFVVVLTILSAALTGFSQPQLTWVGGTQGIDQRGVYGTGTPIPGGRNGGITWTGSDGMLYLYGGYGFGEVAGADGGLCDMWRYNPGTGAWTWLSGNKLVNQDDRNSSDPMFPYTPGTRQNAASWVTIGYLWLFGGISHTGDQWNDMWRYSLSTNEWTLMKGSDIPNQAGNYFSAMGTPHTNNIPGARSEIAGYWKANDGSFWLFGGSGNDETGTTTSLSDVWRFDPASNMWTWMHGEKIVTAPDELGGVYNTQGVEDPANRPGGRYSSSGWFDGVTGNFWLFGGLGYGEDGSSEGLLNDLWRFNTTSKNWTWIKGSKVIDEQGNYGTKGTAAGANAPGARSGHRLWMENGSVFLFGGNGYTPTDFTPGNLNDTWQYNPITKFWTWLEGSKFADPPADYTTSTPALGGRQYPMVWKTNGGPLYSFGGVGYNDVTVGFLNDLWTINTSNITLPVNWGEVSVKEINDGAEIQWTTLQEMKTTSFTVERSTHAGLYITIGTVQTHGENNSPQQYKFVDAHPAEGKNYYRIRENDIDGKQFYSKVVQLDIKRTGNDVVLFPNPVSTVLTIKLPDNNSKATLSLYNFKGDLVLRKNINQVTALPLGQLPGGMYFAKIMCNGRTFIKNIVKQ